MPHFRRCAQFRSVDPHRFAEIPRSAQTRQIRIWVLSLATLLLATARLDAGDTPEPARVFPADPVELAAGREVAGQDQWTVTRDGFVYHFISEQNRSTFTQRPQEFEIQLGGACARMGSLSGVGRVDLFATHNHRIYLFASEACRSGFLKAPDKLLLTSDQTPTGTDSQAAAAREMIARFLNAVGSAETIAQLKSLKASASRPVKSGTTEYDHLREFTIAFPDRLRYHESWSGEYPFSQVANGEAAWFHDARGIRAMVPVQQRDMRSAFSQNYIGLIQLLQDPTRIAFAGTPVTVEQKTLNVFTVHARDRLRTLYQDPDTGRIVRLETRGHGPTMAVETLTFEYRDFQTLDGLTLPTVSVRLKDNQPVEDSQLRWTYEVNGPIDDAVFAYSN